VSKQEIIAAIRQCARKLGRVPTYADIRKETPITRRKLWKHFVNLGHALRETGLEPTGRGHRLSQTVLLKDWGRVTRKLRKVPSIAEYKTHGKFSEQPFVRKFEVWTSLPAVFQKFVEMNRLQPDWPDVLEIISAQQQAEALLAAAGQRVTQVVARGRKPEGKLPPGKRAERRRYIEGRPVYGPPMIMPGMLHAPTNEGGVMILFGMLAYKLGFVVSRTQTGFPDCEALREVEAGRWQRVRIEFEYRSRNFLMHRHKIEGCDLIVCWRHDWPECPESLEVVELSREIKKNW
jgi:HNH endonuclease